jgi:hypothetical protein
MRVVWWTLLALACLVLGVLTGLALVRLGWL